jgi:hypothetical protein
MMSRCRIVSLLALCLVAGSRLLSQGRLRPSDPHIRTTLAVTMRTGDAAAGPLLVDVHLETIGRGDVRRNTFSPNSSFEGLPDFRFVSVPDGDTLVIPPGLFVGGADAWDRWYLPPLRDYELIGRPAHPPAARRPSAHAQGR